MSSQEFVNTLKRLIAREVRTLLPRWRWGQVISTSPLTVELDAEQGAIAGIGTTVAGLMIGDRVQVFSWKNRSTITGIAGGGDTGWVDMPLAAGFTGAGVRYRRVGEFMLIEVRATGSFPVGVTAQLTEDPLPPALRPFSNVRGTGTLNGVAGAAAYTGLSGQIGFINYTGAARTGGEGTITYYLG